MAKKRRGRNEGSLWEDKKRGRWTAHVTVAGKRYTAHAKTKALAQEKLLNLQSKAKQGLLSARSTKTGSTKTVEQVVRDYVDFYVSTGDIRESTAHRYEGIIKNKIAKAPFGSLPVTELTRQHVKDFYAGEYKSNAPATVLKTHNLLSAALKEAVELKQVDENVCAAKKLRPTADKQEAKAFSEEAMNLLLDYARRTKHRDSNLLHVAFRTGLRSGELLGLQWSDVDLKDARLTVNHTLVNYGKKPTLGAPKNGKTRTIDLAADAVVALRDQQALLLSEGHPRPWVFPNTEGQPGNRNHLLQRFKTLCEDAKVPILMVHSTRHTFASLAIKAGVDYKTIQKILGHYSVALTIDTYAHLAPDAQRSAAEKMDRFFAVGPVKVSSKAS